MFCYSLQYSNTANSKMDGGLSETGQCFVGVLAWEMMLMGQRRSLTGAENPWSSIVLQSSGLEPLLPKGQEKPGQDYCQHELITQEPGAADFKPGVIRHKEGANSAFHQPFLESNTKAERTWMLSPPIFFFCGFHSPLLNFPNLSQLPFVSRCPTCLQEVVGKQKGSRRGRSVYVQWEAAGQ